MTVMAGTSPGFVAISSRLPFNLFLLQSLRSGWLMCGIIGLTYKWLTAMLGGAQLRHCSWVYIAVLGGRGVRQS